jgi:hypothetical protein
MRRLAQLAMLPAVPLLTACPFDNQGTAPPVKPDAPVIGAAVAGNATAEISFTPPSNDGGAPISSYSVTCSATGAVTRTASGAASPITVTNLQNGSTYTCSVTATNSAGTSDASSGVSVTPTGPPGAPTIGTVTPANGSASVAFTAPGSNGGSAITGYTATCTATGQATGTNTGAASPIVVSGLINGTQYACSVVATNARGTSSASASANVTPATTPGAPIIGPATAGNGQAQITFTAPASNGGSAITTYAAVCTAAASTPSANGTSSPITVTGMTNGVTYACNVRAANAVGAGSASGDVSVTPVGPPAAPTIGTATPGNGEAVIAFTAPVNTGGSAITTYTVTCTGSSATRTASGSTSPITVTAMTNGVAYTCSVIATNVAGTGGASATVAVTPRTVPSAPTIGAATPGNGSASITFTAGSSGGATITSFTVSCAVGGVGTPVTATGTTTPITVTGLTNNATYLCTVTATNEAGTSSASGSVSVTPVPPTAPGAPTIGTVTAGDESATVAFTAPTSNGGASITLYTVTCTAAGQLNRTATGSASPITVTGLVNAIVWSCSVQATNSVGIGTASASSNVTPVWVANTNTLLCPYTYSATQSPINLLSQVSWTCDNTTSLRTMTSTQIPDHPTPTFPVAGNPHSPTVQSSPSFKATLKPVAVGTTAISQGQIGYAINGVKFDPATAETCPTKSYCPSGFGTGTSWNVEALGQTLFSAGVDNSNAHVQPNGAYHYHGMPTKYMEYLTNSQHTGQKMIFIGYANDGFPIYAKWGYSNALDTTSAIIAMTPSYQMKASPGTGRVPFATVANGTFTQDWEYVAGLGHLDECNGRFGKTKEFPKGIYHYYITDSFPYIQRCIKGTAQP